MLLFWIKDIVFVFDFYRKVCFFNMYFKFLVYCGVRVIIFSVSEIVLNWSMFIVWVYFFNRSNLRKVESGDDNIEFVSIF